MGKKEGQARYKAVGNERPVQPGTSCSLRPQTTAPPQASEGRAGPAATGASKRLP